MRLMLNTFGSQSSCIRLTVDSGAPVAMSRFFQGSYLGSPQPEPFRRPRYRRLGEFLMSWEQLPHGHLV